MPIINPTKQMEMALFTGPHSDANLDAAEQGQAAQAHVATSADDVATPARASNLFSRSNLLKAAVRGLALSAGAAGLAGFGYGMFKAGESHSRAPAPAGGTQRNAALQPPAFAPSALAVASCDAVDTQIDTNIAALLTSSAPAVKSVVQPLYTDGSPHPEDIALVGSTLQKTMLASYGVSGLYRAAVMLELASVDPDFVKSMVVDAGQGNFVVKLHTYAGDTDTFKQVAVPVALSEISPDLLTVDNQGSDWQTKPKVNVPAWWMVVLHAGAKLDNVARPELGITAASQDRTDGKAYQRNAIRSIVGTGTEIVSTDELDMLRDMETIPDSVYDVRSNVTGDNLTPDLRTSMGQLMDSKTDNWSSLLGRMRDSRNVALVNFHQILDFQTESWVRTENTSPFFSFTTANSNTTISGGSTFTDSDGNFISEVVLMSLANGDTNFPKFISCGPSSVYAVVGAEHTGVWLRLAIGDDYGSPQETKVKYPFFVPNDALVEMTASISLARRPCATDSDFLLPRPQYS